MNPLELDDHPLQPWELASCETCDAGISIYISAGWYVCKDIDRHSAHLTLQWVWHCPECAAHLVTVKGPTKVCSCGQRIKPYEGPGGFSTARTLVFFGIIVGIIGALAGFLFAVNMLTA